MTSFPVSFDDLMNTDPKELIPAYIQDAIQKGAESEIEFTIILPDYEAEMAVTNIQCFMAATSLRYDIELPHLKELALDEMSGQIASNNIKFPNKEIAFFFDLADAVESANLLMGFGFLQCGDVFELLGCTEYRPDSYQVPQKIVFNIEELLTDEFIDSNNDDDTWNRLKG